jgi:tRNA-guanine family transglycosylase
MGKLVNFCAGADIKTLPTQPIDALLLNTLDHGSTSAKIAAALEMLKIANPKHSVLDSSGYQILQGQLNGLRIISDSGLVLKSGGSQINLAPQHVMEVASILRPDIVVGLDFPIRKFKSPAEKEAEFTRKLQLNVRWAYDSAVWQKTLCPQVKLFLPVQSYNLEQLEVFFRRTAGIAYDGLSMPVRELDLEEIALFLVRFYQRGTTRVHLLGTASLGVISICAFMAHNLFEWVSLDATSWRKAAEMGDFYNPLDLSREKLTPTVIIDPNIRNDCPCPFCQGQTFSKIQALPRSDKTRLLREHNFWVLTRACHDFYANSADIVSLERFLRSRCKRQELVDEIITTLSLVDALKDVEIEVLQNLLIPPTPTRKPSKASRQQSVPA